MGATLSLREIARDVAQLRREPDGLRAPNRRRTSPCPGSAPAWRRGAGAADAVRLSRPARRRHRLVNPRPRAFLDEDRRRGRVLTETICAVADANVNLCVAAERLQVHPNTAQYRLRRIEERTGRNPRRIADLLDLLVAIALDDAFAPAS
jgi:hypothetical protein